MEIEHDSPDQLPIDFEKDSFGFHMDIDNELSRHVSHNSLRFPMGINHELSRPSSYRFWKSLFWLFHMDIDQELSRPNSHWLRMEFLKASLWELAMSSPDPLPTDFERNSFGFWYGNWSGALQKKSYRFLEKLLKFSIWVLYLAFFYRFCYEFVKVSIW